MNVCRCSTGENGFKDHEIIFVEPFYGGSHKQLIDTLHRYLPLSNVVSLSAKNWHWRARCSALILYESIPKTATAKVLFCSSVLSLSELLGLRPDLQTLRKVLYFHENQLVYPVREIKERDVQYAYNQITSCLTADVVLFNSVYNKSTFLDNIKTILKVLPDYKPKNLRQKIEQKCCVLYYPIDYSLIEPNIDKNNVHTLHIVWPHRWEFDKGPEDFFAVLIRLKENKIKFSVSVIGECFQQVPEIFNEARQLFDDEILHYGFIESKSSYYDVLKSSHVVVSTAKHEFFGVSVVSEQDWVALVCALLGNCWIYILLMTLCCLAYQFLQKLEAVYSGCYPLLPNDLVYPEIYPASCLYSSVDELYDKLSELCKNPVLVIKKRKDLQVDFEQYSVSNLIPKYIQILYNK